MNMSELEEIEKKVKNHEIRLSRIEKMIFKGKKLPKIKETYKGLNGGIRLLIKNGFLDSPKSLKKITEELKRLGYHYSKKSISKALLVDFMKKWHILTRVNGRKGKFWKYVVKK